jgi:hypothetical protein
MVNIIKQNLHEQTYPGTKSDDDKVHSDTLVPFPPCISLESKWQNIL